MGLQPRPRSAGEENAIDCLLTRRTGLPRDRMGHQLNEAGRWLIIEAATSLYALDANGAELVRDEHRRWILPQHRLMASVTHCAEFAAVAFSHSGPVGVDLQDVRPRPHAMRWLASLLGHPDTQNATIGEFVECEALIKASHLTKQTFPGTRLPAWKPGWRATNTAYHVRSETPQPELRLALAATCAAPVRWWHQPSPGQPSRRTNVPTLEPM